MPDGGRALLMNISWATYRALLADVGDGHARLTYDQGWLEIEMPGRLHEQINEFMSEIVTTVLKRSRVPYSPAGSTTWLRPDVHRGLEADQSYHIQSVARVVGKLDVDLTVDPPPDLAIEVEVASPLLDKVSVYAGLGVPELWRVRADGSCDFLRLGTAGQYQPIDGSAAVPPLTPAVVSQYLRLLIEVGFPAASARFEAEFVATLPT